jgi:hypothetical protein
MLHMGDKEWFVCPEASQVPKILGIQTLPTRHALCYRCNNRASCTGNVYARTTTGDNGDAVVRDVDAKCDNFYAR